MLKYQSVIEKLNLRQKLALLTDVKSLSDAEIVRAGVPFVSFASLEEINGAQGLYPTLFQLARSWDPQLFGEVSRSLAAEGARRGIGLVLSPDLKSGTSPYCARLAEDPLLCGKLGAGCLDGMRRAGVGSVLGRYCLGYEDAEYLDVKAEPSVIRELYARPFEIAEEEAGGADAYLGSLARVSGDYSDVNRRMAREESGKEGFLLCEDVPHDADLHVLLKGNVFLGGAVMPLDAAIGRYRRLERLVGEGGASPSELDEALKKGAAISEETIDEAVDRVVGFAHRIAEKKAAAAEKNEELARRAYEESVVLLKNRETLPLAPQTKVALVGAVAAEGEDNFVRRFSQIAKLDHDLEYLGYADGYLLAEDRSEEEIPAAVRLAEEADVVLLFLGPGAERERALSQRKSVSLPANQLALVGALLRTGKKIVSVVVGDVSVDMSFDKNLHASLLAPAGGALCCDVLADLLTGKRNPSGRLSRTCYDNTDELFLALKNYKDAGRNRVGKFVGYRRYDTAGDPPRYPFGHGLGYTRFTYSGLETNETGVRFILSNRGGCKGKEVVQVYAGKRGVRPKKELVAFAKIELEAGESRSVEIPLPDRLFTYYNGDRAEVDGGTYRLFIGSSVEDIRLNGLYTVKGEGRAEKDERFADYLQSESNLMYKGYSLKEARERAIRNWKERRGIRLGSFILLGLCLFTDLLLVAAQASGVLSGSGAIAGLFLVNVLLAVSVVALVCERATRGKKAVSHLPPGAERLERADRSKTDDPEAFFLKALEEKEEEETHETVSDGEDFFDETLTFARACEELARFTADRGVAITADGTRALFSAIASSRCLVFQGPVKPIVSLLGLMSEYFGCPFLADTAEGYRAPEDLFYKEGAHGVRVKTEFSRALLSANDLRPYLQLAVLNRVKADALAGFFAPVAERLKDPRGGKPIEFDDGGKDRYSLPPNLRIALVLAEGQDVADLPADLADACCVLRPEITLVPPKEEKSLASPFGYRQLSELTRLAKMTCEPDEAQWKKVDRLESLLNEAEPYRLGNKVWLGLENYAAVYLACGGGQESMIDSAVAARLLARAMAIWKRTGEEKKLLSALEEIFGAGGVPRCGKMLRSSAEEG